MKSCSHGTYCDGCRELSWSCFKRSCNNWSSTAINLQSTSKYRRCICLPVTHNVIKNYDSIFCLMEKQMHCCNWKEGTPDLKDTHFMTQGFAAPSPFPFHAHFCSRVEAAWGDCHVAFFTLMCAYTQGAAWDECHVSLQGPGHWAGHASWHSTPKQLELGEVEARGWVGRWGPGKQ